MNVTVKGMNDILFFRFNDKANFTNQLNDLNKLLEQPLFLQEGYYPKAFFDFGCHFLSDKEFENFALFLMKKKKVLFYGMNYPGNNESIDLIHESIRNGESLIIYHQTLFVGVINPGSDVYCYCDVYFLNKVRGRIHLMNENVKVFGNCFADAYFIYNQTQIRNLTTFSLTSVYYKDNELIVNEEDGYDKNSFNNFW